MISLRRLAQIGCVTVAVAPAFVLLLLCFWLPWWLDGPTRDAERRVEETMTAGLEAAARAGGLDAHAALRTAEASHVRLLLFADDADGTRIDVEHLGYGSFGARTVTDFCYRFAVERGPKARVRAIEQDRCARPPSAPGQATARIREAAEETRAALAAANKSGPVTRERARPVVTGDLSALWSFQRESVTETIAVADYISLTPTGQVEAAECIEFSIIREPEKREVTLHRLPGCRAP
ncbi:hypothetical protein [Actinomadura sp. GTD37]|uniref:hypothetical protein n=1 Tax=Actinomadura sp. GTD37 TaxID=1778030 RepID=UPI0035C11BFF